MKVGDEENVTVREFTFCEPFEGAQPKRCRPMTHGALARGAQTVRLFFVLLIDREGDTTPRRMRLDLLTPGLDVVAGGSIDVLRPEITDAITVNLAPDWKQGDFVLRLFIDEVLTRTATLRIDYVQ